MASKQTKSSVANSKKFSTDYHDYMFKDGQFLADFDNMYRYSEEAPWKQDERCHAWHFEVGFAMLRELGRFHEVLEIGCGLGYIASRLKQAAGDDISAFDVSPEAIRRAKLLHSGINFFVEDITKASFTPIKRYDLVVVCQVLSWVFPHLKTVLTNIDKCTKPGGALYVCQSFPRLETSFFGKDVLPNPASVRACFPSYESVLSAELFNHHIPTDGPVFHFLGRKPR